MRRVPLLVAGRHHRWSAATMAVIAEEFNALLGDPEVNAIIAHGGRRTVLRYSDFSLPQLVLSLLEPAARPHAEDQWT